MRKVILTLTTIFATTAAYSAPPPPEGPIDTNVLSMPPVEISGARVDRFLNIERVGGTNNGTLFEFALPSGRLHATSVSIASPEEGEACNISTWLRLTDVNTIISRKSLGSNVTSTGQAVGITQSYPTPVEVRLNNETVSAELVFQVSGGAATCTVNLSAVYEFMDANGN